MCGTQSTKSIILKINKVERKFYSFWLKDVKDVDLSKHCIKCLKGHRYMEITQEPGCTLTLDGDKIYYLCGVTYPYVWEKNFHLAFQYDEHENIYGSQNGVNLTLYHAKIIHFSEKDVDSTLPQAEDPKFFTCRNWQFANYFEKHLKEKVYNNSMKNQQTSFWHCQPYDSR